MSLSPVMGTARSGTVGRCLSYHHLIRYELGSSGFSVPARSMH
jgi:hypothetical protein